MAVWASRSATVLVSEPVGIGIVGEDVGGFHQALPDRLVAERTVSVSWISEGADSDGVGRLSFHGIPYHARRRDFK
jgi:hypothetical protein